MTAILDDPFHWLHYLKPHSILVLELFTHVIKLRNTLQNFPTKELAQTGAIFQFEASIRLFKTKMISLPALLCV